MTEDGWANAWQFLVELNPAAVPEILARLKAREVEAASRRAQEELDARSLVALRMVGYLGGYVPGSAITPGGWYDVRFLEDRLVVVACIQAEVLAEVPYGEVEDVEIGGPGLVSRCCCCHRCRQLGAGRPVACRPALCRGMARSRSGQAPAWPLVSDGVPVETPGSSMTSRDVDQALSACARCPAGIVILEAGGADTDTQQAIPGSKPFRTSGLTRTPHGC